MLAILWWEIWLGKLGLGLIMAGLILDVALVRCPVCGVWLGKDPGPYCRACGVQLDWKKKKKD